MVIYKKISWLVVVLTLVYSCTSTTVKHVKTTFVRPNDSIKSDLDKLMACEKINIDGREITTNGKMNSELVIEIINCRNLLSNQNNMSELGKKVATIFKKSLENRNAYSVYKTIFVTKKEIGGITKRDWTEIPFKTEEL